MDRKKAIVEDFTQLCLKHGVVPSIEIDSYNKLFLGFEDDKRCYYIRDELLGIGAKVRELYTD